MRDVEARCVIRDRRGDHDDLASLILHPASRSLRLQHFDEGFLRDVDFADAFHPLFLLFVSRVVCVCG